MAKAKLQWMEIEEVVEFNEDVVRTACLDRLDLEWQDDRSPIDWDSLDSTLHRYEWH